MRNITELYRVQAAVDTTSGVVVAATLVLVENMDGILWRLSLSDILEERRMWNDVIEIRILSRPFPAHFDNKERQTRVQIPIAKEIL